MKIDLGCGVSKSDGHIGVDRLLLPEVDVVADLEAPLPFLTDSVDALYSKSVLEHLTELELALSEIHRVVKTDGVVHILVPHFSSPFGFSDYTHRRFFGYFTFDYFVPASDQKSRRKVPDFYTTFKFRILSKRLQFDTYIPPLRPLLRLWEWLVNSSELAALVYESLLCYVVPCYSIEVRLTPLKPKSERPSVE